MCKMSCCVRTSEVDKARHHVASNNSEHKALDPFIVRQRAQHRQAAGEVRCISGFAGAVGHYCSKTPCPREINDALHVQEIGSPVPLEE